MRRRVTARAALCALAVLAIACLWRHLCSEEGESSRANDLPMRAVTPPDCGPGPGLRGTREITGHVALPNAHHGPPQRPPAGKAGEVTATVNVRYQGIGRPVVGAVVRLAPAVGDALVTGTDINGSARFRDFEDAGFPAEFRLTVSCWTDVFRSLVMIRAVDEQEFLVEVPVRAPPFTVRGVVRDARSGEPVTGARILERLNGAKATSDEDGRFDLFFVPWRESSGLDCWVWASGYSVASLRLDEDRRSSEDVVISLYPGTPPASIDVAVTQGDLPAVGAVVEFRMPDPGSMAHTEDPAMLIEQFLSNWECLGPADTSTRRLWGPFTMVTGGDGKLPALYLQSGTWNLTATQSGAVSELVLHLGAGEERAVGVRLGEGQARRIEVRDLPAAAHPVSVVVESSYHIDRREYFRGALGPDGNLEVRGLPFNRDLDIRLSTADGWSLNETLGPGEESLVSAFPALVSASGWVTWRGAPYRPGDALLEVRGLLSKWQTSCALVAGEWRGLQVPQEACLFSVSQRASRARGVQVPLVAILRSPVRVELDYKTRLKDGLVHPEPH